MKSKLSKKYSMIRKAAIVMNVIFVYQLVFPTVALALTSGPVTPEFSQFEPVATTNMVNLFTGDMTYNIPVINIPGANGGGYQMSLSYHSGTNAEEEASWVGYGWTLNPGAITRNKRGFPDDWNGASVKYWNKAPANQTVSVGGSISAEFFSIDAALSLNASIRYNNYKGFGYNAGAGISDIRGIFNLGYNVSDGEGSFSLRVNPLGALSKKKEIHEKQVAIDAEKAKLTDDKPENEKRVILDNIQKLSKSRDEMAKSNGNKIGGSGIGQLGLIGGAYGIFSYAGAGKASNVADYYGTSISISASGMPTALPFDLGGTLGLSGSYSYQKNTDNNTLPAYGYMYNSSATSADAMMDYYVEKGSDYNKQDVFLGIPFSNADNFSLSGEGLGGGFRMYNTVAGHYKPNNKISTTSLFSAGADFDAGLAFGGGGRGGGGAQNVEIGAWNSRTSFSNENFFRFNNDMGGWVTFGDEKSDGTYDSHGEAPQNASILKDINVPGIKTMRPNVSSIDYTMDKTYDYDRNSRSSFVSYSKNSDLSVVANNTAYRAYEKDADVRNLSSRQGLDNQIGEFSVVNENGQRYNYGHPVYTRKEKNLQFDVKGANIDHGFLAYKDISNYNTLETVQGEERDLAYASTYLLTSISDVDYIDRTNNGPTDDDFGGYTKFVYQTVHGAGLNDWYKYRMPYTGLSYSKNELSYDKDDMGSVNEGERQTCYLQRIETKTHVALFITSDRNDGIEANHDAKTAATNRNAKGSKKLKKLDRIELYLKEDLNSDYTVKSGAKPLKVVNFQYDNHLIKGVINSTDPSTVGKLTLNKMWFDYEGTYNAKISPYEFYYDYATTDYPSKYDAFENYGAGKAQNPNYSEFNLDAWGNYQANGDNRYAEMKHWLNQNQNDPNVQNFDPAAWQLKRIKLPSGGEIHVQYEQDDYSYVQDKLAHAMVSLKAYNDSQSKYYLNLDDMGIMTTDADYTTQVQKLVNLIRQQYVDTKKRMYFKFLYKLMGSTAPDLSQCNVEYISGYVLVKSVSHDATHNTVELELKSTGIGKHDTPFKVCKEFVKTQKAGLVNVATGCIPDLLQEYAGASDARASGQQIVKKFLNKAKDFNMNSIDASACGAISEALSYIRVPMIKAKKGGGLRVKRVLMYDAGIRTGSPELYGSEYVYTTKNDNGEIISSGVAVNEPGGIREENILTDFIDRKKQNLVQKIISGEDKKKSEGPIGESVMPSPSVGYSKVIVKNIHSGKTNTGFIVNEFFTAKDFPFEVRSTEIKEESDFLPIPGGFVNRYVNNVWLTQGFSFWINNMHGQQKKVATYAGNYSDAEIHNPDQSTLVSAQEYTYFGKDELIPVLTSLSQIQLRPLGKEMEVAFETREVKDNSIDGNVEFDTDAGIFGIAVVGEFTIMPSVTVNQAEMRSHVTSKVINWPAVQKSVKSFADGVWSETVNLAFSPYNGQPVVTRTFDGYNGLAIASQNHDGGYTSYSIPAGFEYENFKGKFINEGKIFSSNSLLGISINKVVENGKAYLEFTDPSGGCGSLNDFVSGDLLKLSSGSAEIFHVGEKVGKRLQLLPVSYGALGASANSINVEVLRSGRNNMLAQMIGNFVTYGGIDALPTYTQNTSITSSSEYARRVAFANQLNAIKNGGTLAGNQIASNLLVDPTGTGCWSSPSAISISVTGNSLNLSAGNNTTHQDYCGYSASNPHPVVTYLNDLFNSIWGKPITGDVFRYAGGFPYSGIYIYDNNNCNIRQLITQKLNTSFSCINGESSVLLKDKFYIAPNESESVGNTIVDAFSGFSKVGSPNQFYAAGLSWYTISPSGNGPFRSFEFEFKPETVNRSDYSLKVNLFQDICNPIYGTEHYATANQSELTPYFGNSFDGKYTDLVGHFVQTDNHTLGYFDIVNNCTIELPELKFYTNVQESLCQTQLKTSNSNAHFGIDQKTGELLFYADASSCGGVSVDCLKFCTPLFPSKTITNVVSASAQTFSDNWDYDASQYNLEFGTIANQNDYETGRKGKWRTTTSYSYRTSIQGLGGRFNPTTSLTGTTWAYNSGTFDLDLFNYQSISANDTRKWLPLNTVTKYSPHGQALEEANILNIKSSAKFGYHSMLPYLIAKNADNQSVQFESFENRYGSTGQYTLEEGIPVNDFTYGGWTSGGHSGKQCYGFTYVTNFTFYTFKNFTLTNQILNKGLQVKFWAKGFENVGDFKLKCNLNTASNFNVVKVAQSGEWTLFEATLNQNDWNAATVGSNVSISLVYDPLSKVAKTIYVDDMRLQPLDAEMACYVYDKKNFRVLATFDDQHFGVYYIYDLEGKLVRKLVETERGMKTITETHYNTPSQNRNTVITH